MLPNIVQHRVICEEAYGYDKFGMMCKEEVMTYSQMKTLVQIAGTLAMNCVTYITANPACLNEWQGKWENHKHICSSVALVTLSNGKEFNHRKNFS